jgi:hypothetical protein
MEIHDELRREIKSHALAHMVKAIRRAPEEHEPFPHVIAHEIFPPEVYREMLALLPDVSLYEAFSYEKHATNGTSNRGRFKLTDDEISRLGGRQRSLWLGVRDALGAPEFKAAVFSKLRAGLAFRFGVSPAQAAEVPAFPLPELFRETSGYSIKPHPDTRKKVVTMQIALPKDNKQEDLGTEFYRRSLNPLHLFREPRGFEVAKKAPFLPNVAYAFAVINAIKLKSWHGRTTLHAETGERNSILNIWYANAAHANPDIMAQYYSAAKPQAA